MKLLRNYGVALALALTPVMFQSCGDAPIEHGTEYILMADDGASAADLTTTVQVITNRLNSSGMEGDFEITQQGNKITVRVREGVVQDASRIRDLLQVSTGLMFRATYTAGEVGGAINEAHTTYLRMNHIDSANAGTSGLAAYLMPSDWNNPSTPIIGFCLPKDTAALNRILQTDSIALLFPSDLIFRWGTGIETADGKQTFALLACKKGYNYELGGEHVAEAKVDERDARMEITINFDMTGTTAWAKLTKANVGRSIAIEVGEFVYSYPSVNSEITGGSAVVSGNFTREEADDLAAILNAGSMPVRVSIVEEKTF